MNMPYNDNELKRELLYGTAFLDRFERQLNSLKADAAFVELIASIRQQSRERYGESLQEEKRYAANVLYENGAVKTYKALGEIVEGVKADGYTITSALITSYIAMYLLDADTAHSEGGKAAIARSGGAAPFNEVDFRLRWKAEYRCEDGHYVRSKNEAIVDNWLYSHGICHAYEKAVFDPDSGDTLCSDFYVPAMNLYIEIWGMSSQEYVLRRERKTALYGRLGCRLIEIDGDTVKNIDDVLSRELAQCLREKA